MTRRLFSLFAFLLLAATAQAQTGSVKTASLYSPALGITLDYRIYLPPGYDSDTETRYPVVYLFRGHEREWVNPSEDPHRGGTDLRHVANSLIGNGTIHPMIFVMPPTVNDVDYRYYTLGVNMVSPPANNPTVGTGNWQDFLFNDLISHIDATYRTLASPAHRGVDGFSLGGYTSMLLATKFPHLFRTAGSYDGTLMWLDFNDTRRNDNLGYGPNVDDGTWLTTNLFDAAFGKPRHLDVMKANNPANLVRDAQGDTLDALRAIHFFIHTAANPQQSNFERGKHMADQLQQRGISNRVPQLVLHPSAAHNWYWADRYLRAVLPLHSAALAPASTATAPEARPDQPGLEPPVPSPAASGTPVGIGFTLGKHETIRLTIHDVLGRQIAAPVHGVLGPGLHRHTLDTTGWPPGLYLLVLQTETGRHVRRLVVGR